MLGRGGINAVRSLARTAQAPVVTKLDNGVVVVTDKTSNNLACVGAVVGSGSRDDPEKGSANVAKHITLQTLANTTNPVQWTNSSERERTSFFGVCLGSDSASVAGELVEGLNSSGNVDEARKAAQAELDHSSTNYTLVVDDYLHMASFRNTPLGDSPMGTTTGINNGDAANFRRNTYVGPNVTFVASGDVDHDELCKVAEGINGRTHIGTHRSREPFVGSKVQDRNDFEIDCWFQTAIHTPGFDDPKIAMLFQVFAEVGGSWAPGAQHAQFSTNFLEQKYNHNRPIRRQWYAGKNAPLMSTFIDSLSANFNCYSDCGLFGFSSHIKDAHAVAVLGIKGHARAFDVVRPIQDEMKRYPKITDFEVSSAKNRLIGKLGLKLSSPLGRAEQMGLSKETHLATSSFAATQRAINDITTQDMREAAKKYILDTELTHAYYGATEGSMDLSNARGRSWNVLGW